jgi:Uma2 family endonuclease
MAATQNQAQEYPRRPNDLFYQVEEKVGEWLEAGVRLLWVVNPNKRHVRVYRADGSDTLLGEEDELSGEDLVPGFRCRAGQISVTLRDVRDNI